MFASGLILFADALTPWDWNQFALAVITTVTFGVIGIILAFIGFKLFDMLTPGKLEEEIVQKQNIAAAILGAAIIIGICLIVMRAVGG
jgi:putative membrane protein